MENTQSEIVESLDSLKELNSKLLAQNDELRKENVKVKAENAKLKQALEEHESRFTNLEQRDKEKSNLIAKLEYDVSLIKEESLQDNNTTSVSEEIPVSSETCQPICTDPKSLEDKKIDDFLDLTEKERASNMMKERNREKKFRDQELIQKTSFSSENPTTEKVEQGLIHELSVCAERNIATQDIDVQIPELPLKIILAGSDEITAQIIVDLFNMAMKTRQKENLYWYCFSKAYEDRVRDIKFKNKIDDQSARTLVYNEIRLLLPDTPDVNLRNRTFKAKKVYILFEGIGIDKIRQVSYSASAISSLKDDQIQNIINCFSKIPELIIKNESDIDTLIGILQQKFKMSKEKLEQWRENIAFELRDNSDYWKPKRESMSEVDFLEYKQKFEAMGVPTTPYKNELKERSLALIAYG
nr:15246_t:CDS:2 [Entrophospora candida]